MSMDQVNRNDRLIDQLDEAEHQKVLHQLAATDLTFAAAMTVYMALSESRNLGELNTKLLLVLPLILVAIAMDIIRKAIEDQKQARHFSAQIRE